MHTPPCILIVDDQSMNVDILSSRLRLEGYEVLTATDGAEAIAIAKERQPDLIMLDVIMPGLDGLEVCRRLKADLTLPFIPILMITAKGEPKDIVAGLEAGADEYLAKPVERTVLVARVAALLRVKARYDTAHDKCMQVERQAAELETWGRELEEQIHFHVNGLERVGLLKPCLSPEVMKAVMSLGNGADEGIEGRKEITILSCSLRGFETFVERTEPTSVFEILRDYHQVIAPLTNVCNGTLARFASDELQFWFDAQSCQNPIEQAVRMAVSMREQLMSQCEKWRSSRYGLDVGIGVAHGEVTVGLIELNARLDYAVIGAVRRLASCLAEKAQGANVLISQPVWEEVGKRFEAEPTGQLFLNGYSNPIPYFEVKNGMENAS